MRHFSDQASAVPGPASGVQVRRGQESLEPDILGFAGCCQECGARANISAMQRASRSSRIGCSLRQKYTPPSWEYLQLARADVSQLCPQPTRSCVQVRQVVENNSAGNESGRSVAAGRIWMVHLLSRAPRALREHRECTGNVSGPCVRVLSRGRCAHSWWDIR